MKILVCSDSHGNRENLRCAIKRERPAVVFHLGDGRADILQVMRDWPEIELHSVAGNCDWRSRQRTEELVTLEGCRFLLSHGHEHAVKSGYESYFSYGLRRRVDVLLAGHTHVPCVKWQRGILLMNPGSIGMGTRPSYGILEPSGGEIVTCRIQRLEPAVSPR